MHKSRRSFLFALSFLGLAVFFHSEAIGLVSYARDAAFNYNFHVAAADKLYRSAEMDHATLSETIHAYNIQSVINLRLGGDQADENGLTEGEVVQSLGKHYLHLPLNSRRIPAYGSVEQLLDAFNELPKPILVHCSSGTYRSGAVSALFLLEQERQPIEVALKQLSIRYGYYRPARQVWALMKKRQNLEDILFEYQLESTNSSLSFRQWAKSHLSESESRHIIN